MPRRAARSRFPTPRAALRFAVNIKRTTKFEECFSACPGGVRPSRPRLAARTRLGPRRRRALAESPAPARYARRWDDALWSKGADSPSSFRFFFDGQQVRGDQTPLDFDMVNGDIIESRAR